MYNYGFVTLAAKGNIDNKINDILCEKENNNSNENNITTASYVATHKYEIPTGSDMETVLTSMNGDMITNITIKITLPLLQSGLKWVDDISDAILKSCKIQNTINDTPVIFAEITNHYIHMLSNITNKKYTYKHDNIIYINIPFWFCKYKKYPLLLNHNKYFKVLYLHVYIETINELVRDYTLTNNKLSKYTGKELNINVEISCQYQLCDNQFRSQMANNKIINKLYEKIQYKNIRYDKITKHLNPIKLDFSSQCRELLWVYSDKSAITSTYFNYINVGDNISIYMNGIYYCKDKEKEFFLYQQPFIYHSNALNDSNNKNIYVYSFSLSPEDIESKTTVNLSRLDMEFCHKITTDKKIEFKMLCISNDILKYIYGIITQDQI
jgi:hypothetical protein